MTAAGGHDVQADGMARVREETAADIDAIRAVNEAAFGQSNEADLVDALRNEAQLFISLVAEHAGRVVGHICFSPVTIGSAITADGCVGLAPMAVLPAFQKQQIGAQLVTMGLDACRRRHQGVVVVVGHPTYYPRFGFVAGSTRGLTCEYPVPDEAFMVLEIQPGALRGRRGVVRYHPVFAKV
jgi:putative acetyltransferase